MSETEDRRDGPARTANPLIQELAVGHMATVSSIRPNPSLRFLITAIIYLVPPIFR